MDEQRILTKPDPTNEEVLTNFQRERNLKLRMASLLAVAVALFLIVIKAFAWAISGSVALLGSLMDSLLDFSISLMNFFVVRHAMIPADAEHRFGHGKAEAMAAFVQGMVIAGSAGFLLYESIHAFIYPRAIEHSDTGIVVMGVSIVVTMGLIFVQRRVVADTGSLAISADSTHYLGDLYMNLGVIGALVLAGGFGWTYADPILGIFVVGVLLHSAYEVFSKAKDQLMDHELPDDQRQRIRTRILSHPDVQGMHDLRTRKSGTSTFIQCHVELSGNLTLYRAHDISDEVEQLVLEECPDGEVIIHLDPYADQKEQFDITS